MPMTDLLTIGEVAERSGLATSALRFYESEGLIRAHRTAGGQRRYHREVLRRLAFVRAAQRVGLTLAEVAAAMARLPPDRAPTARQWEQLASRWRDRLDERIELLQKLRDDLGGCIGCGCLSLRACRLFNPDDVAAGLGDGPRYLFGDSSEVALARRR
jgi:MerR family redox-sensitive transcriptional activator SoxR